MKSQGGGGGEKNAAPESEKNAAPESVKYPGWKAMPYVIGNETCEKLGTVGLMANQLVYLTSLFHLKSVTAATIMSIFNGTANMVPLLGAFITDNFAGRYATIAFASLASLLGMVLLTLTAAVRQLHPAPCKGGVDPCNGPTLPQWCVLCGAFFLLIVGAAGIRPCTLAFGADQFDPRTESGRRGIDSFFNWYYCTFTCAMMVSGTVIVYIQSNISWTLGLAIPAGLMLMSCAAFFVGSKCYVKVKPEGSPFTGIVQVMVAVFKKRHENENENEAPLFDPPHLSSLVSKLQHTDQFQLLDKAAIVTWKDKINSNGEAANPWRLCTVQQVEVVKCLLRMTPVWLSCVLFYIPVQQHNTFTVYQALQMDRRLRKSSSFRIPAGSFVTFTMLTLTLWIPFYDRIVVPQLRKLTKHKGGITILQRMGVGIGISILGMVVSALVERRRRDIALHLHAPVPVPALGRSSRGGDVSSMSSLWLLPQLALFGLSEAFNMIGQTEFFYHQFPENMRSVGMSVFCLGQAVSNYISGALVNVVDKATGQKGGSSWLAQDLNDGRLDLYYMTVAGIAALNLLYFSVCAKWYQFNSASEKEEPLPV